MKVYYAAICTDNHGEFVDVIYTFSITEFNGLYMDCQNIFYCHPSCKTIIDFDDKLSEQEIIDKLSKYGILIMKSQIPIDELDKMIEEINKEHHFEICKEEDFEHMSSDEFLSKIKPDLGFSIGCVKAGIKSNATI